MVATLFDVTKLDAAQVLTHAYDESTQSLRTTATIDVSAGQVEVSITHLEDSVRLGDGIGFFTSTVAGAQRALDVSVVGSLTATLSGLSGGINNGSVTATDIAAKIPLSAFAGRDAIGVRVWGINTVYFGKSSVTATGSVGGYPKLQYEEMVLDITDALDLYFICDAGLTSEVRFIELA